KCIYYVAKQLTADLLFFWIPSSMCCNNALCTSDVSKCLIQELCQCRPVEGNCSCCKERMLCLGTLWDECCDCVGMRNPRKYSDTPPTSKSTAEELHGPITSLFQALTEGDTQLHWNTENIVLKLMWSNRSPHISKHNCIKYLISAPHPYLWHSI
uniref:Tsg N-terminal domain-containing protein n=1 Tax=Podarcis muralis TaxID=64176 RepID=A0A670JB04_PODMU